MSTITRPTNNPITPKPSMEDSKQNASPPSSKDNNNNDDKNKANGPDTSKTAIAVASASSITVSAVVPRPADVLHGRGFPYQTHDGNKRLHEICEACKHKYLRSKRIDKRRMVQAIVKYLKVQDGARFLKRAAKGDHRIEVTDREARDKVGHTLRARLEQQQRH